MAVASRQVRSPATVAADATAVEAAFFEHYTRVYAVLFRLVGDRAEAEDLALETFLKLWQAPPAHQDNLGGWLYRVATRLGYNALRAAQRRARYEEQAAREAAADQAHDPAHEAERLDERRRVRQALAKLSERDAQLLIMRYSGLGYKEIAAALGISPNSVGTLLNRAEERFEEAF